MKIEHWRYEDGWHSPPAIIRKDPKLEWEFNPENQGWFCWVYPDNDQAFEQWVECNFVYEHDLAHRFNGGYPMYTLMIRNKNDAGRFVQYAYENKINLQY